MNLFLFFSNHGFKLELPDLEEISDPPSGRNEKLK